MDAMVGGPGGSARRDLRQDESAALSDLLGRAELFEALDDESLGQVVAAARSVTYARNHTIFVESSDASELYVVRKGRVAIAKSSADGRESMVALMEPGDLFGEMGLFDRRERSADARTLERTELVAVPYGALTAVLEQRPTLLWHVVEMLVRRLRANNSALVDSMFLDVTGRTAKRVLELAGDATEFALPVTQEELAGMVGASRERVNKALATFVRLGWLEQVERRYRLLNREQLARRAL